jgi:hypothetical protein
MINLRGFTPGIKAVRIGSWNVKDSTPFTRYAKVKLFKGVPIYR